MATSQLSVVLRPFPPPPNSADITVQVPRTSTVAELKNAACGHLGCEASCLRIVYRGSQLADGEPLSNAVAEVRRGIVVVSLGPFSHTLACIRPNRSQ